MTRAVGLTESVAYLHAALEASNSCNAEQAQSPIDLRQVDLAFHMLPGVHDLQRWQQLVPC